MAALTLPKTITQTLHYYLYSCAPGAPVMFEHELADNDPNWLFLFSTTIEIPVPDGTLETLYAGIAPRFEAARERLKLKAGEAIVALHRMQANLLAIEN